MVKAKSRKIGVTMRAVIQRINRKLHGDEKILRTARSERMRQEYGDYFVVGWRIGGVDEARVDPEELGRELGVLKDWEAVVE